MKKGVSPLIAAVLLVAMSTSLGTIIFSFATTLSQNQAKTLENQSNTKLACQFANYYIKNASINCRNDCSANVNHTIDVTVINSGKRSVWFNTITILNETGTVTTLNLNETTKLNIGEVITLTNTTITSCSSYNQTIERIYVTNVFCPNTEATIPGADVQFLNCG